MELENYKLPQGWTWETVKEQRAKWDINENFYPYRSAQILWAYAKPP